MSLGFNKSQQNTPFYSVLVAGWLILALEIIDFLQKYCCHDSQQSCSTGTGSPIIV